MHGKKRATAIVSECMWWLSGDCENGFGKTQYSDGAAYEGQWQNSRRHGSGTGTFIATPGLKYEGQWENDSINLATYNTIILLPSEVSE